MLCVRHSPACAAFVQCCLLTVFKDIDIIRSFIHSFVCLCMTVSAHPLTVGKDAGISRPLVAGLSLLYLRVVSSHGCTCVANSNNDQADGIRKVHTRYSGCLSHTSHDLYMFLAM